MSENGEGGQMGVREAARSLGLNPSTVSRYLQEFPGLNLAADGERPRVDLDALRQHRAEFVDPAYQQSHAGEMMAAGDKPKKPDATTAFRLARASRENTMAQTARVDLDVKKKLLVPIAEVETGIVKAGLTLLQALLDLGSRMGDELAAMDSPHEIAKALEAEHRDILHEFRASLEVMAKRARLERPSRDKA